MADVLNSPGLVSNMPHSPVTYTAPAIAKVSKDGTILRRDSKLDPVTETEVVPTPPRESSPSAQEITSLMGLLERAAKSSAVCSFYPPGSAKAGRPAKTISYTDLLTDAKAKAPIVAALAAKHQQGDKTGIVLLHFDSIQDNVTWFWATIAAGLSPAVSTPLPTNHEQRRKHLTHLTTLLDKPIVLTTLLLHSEVDGMGFASVSAVGDLKEPTEPVTIPESSSPSVFMLTSGSSGNAKAVELRPAQIVAAVKGKSDNLESNKDDIFLNWIGFDHVANLTEAHLQAMYLGAEQVHVPAVDVITEPLVFLDLISKHKVTGSFAPNFFLARLLTTLEDSTNKDVSYDLSCLRRIQSGGEANVVETTMRLTEAMRKFGTPENLIRPGFGMTETCAGCIYNSDCPSHDVTAQSEFASLGKPNPTIEMRIVREDGTQASTGEVGFLQVSGPSVFTTYYNNPKATEESFTADGWFITGDKASINAKGFLNLSGRDKEAINLNGVKYAPHEIETAIEESGQPDVGITPSYTAVFSIRPHNSGQEEICVIYNPTFPLEDVDARIKTSKTIVRVVGEVTSSRPKHIIPLPQKLLPKSSLGKLSRAKLRTAFEKGEFREYEDRLNPALKERRDAQCDAPSTDVERMILEELTAMQGLNSEDDAIGVNISIFDFGITSVDLFVLGERVYKKAGLEKPLPVGTLLTDPTVRGIAQAIEQAGYEASGEYVPIVPLQKEGSKTPLFLIHPGSGDVLIFVALAKYFPDRPVYGIRTRALYSDSKNYFNTLDEMADTYVKAIKEVQPEGPYAVAGYSLGSSVAYEVAKKFLAGGDEVPFLGILDSPPHIKHLIGCQDFIDVLLNVAYFLELITSDYAMVENTAMHQKTDSEALDIVLASAPPDRLKVLGIDKARLFKITECTRSFGQAGKDYVPLGSVPTMDVFYVTPLQWVASGRKEWMDEHLCKWVDFVDEAPQFHECDGVHSKMLNAEFVDGVAKKMRAVIKARGA